MKLTLTPFGKKLGFNWKLDAYGNRFLALENGSKASLVFTNAELIEQRILQVAPNE